MQNVKLKLPSMLVLAGLVGLGSTSALAGFDCSVEQIKSLPQEQQLERYGTCINLLKQQHELLKTQKDVRSLQNPDSVKLTDGLPAPTPVNGQNVSLANYPSEVPDSVLSVEGVGNSLVATLSWASGRKMAVQAGSKITNTLMVSSVTLNGVEIIDSQNKNQPIFIGVGQSGLQNQQPGTPYPYPMQ